ncbi:hypothetical protein Tco_0677982 [Tanacetum coccineum]|uniref:Uncharacterized protein n=1 Tax=Tanacetum coccineum TaxID=301880 RepID=A0ABQ4XDU1_9ASTR
MSDSEDSTVTYTAVSSPFADLPDIGSPGVDGPPVMPEDPYAYVVAAFQAPPSPDYVPGPEYPPSPEFVPGSAEAKKYKKPQTVCGKRGCREAPVHKLLSCLFMEECAGQEGTLDGDTPPPPHLPTSKMLILDSPPLVSGAFYPASKDLSWFRYSSYKFGAPWCLTEISNESSLGYPESATLTSSQKVLTSSLEYFDAVIRNYGVISTNYVPYLDHLHIELQSCPVSSQIESNSCVLPPNAFQMLK